MDRKEYLSKIWQQYPAMPTEAIAAGRIYDLRREEDGSLKLTLHRDQKIHKIQFAKASVEAEFLDYGDLVAILPGEKILLLAPQLNPLPRRTYQKDLLEKWSLYLDEVRSFFRGQNFVELKTPSLVTCPGTEPSLDVFSTELKIGSRKEKLFLPTSPELHLKKVLALGAEKIFEIAPCFRNGELTERHQPEFMMLEWYRAYDNLAGIKKDVVDLVNALASHFQVSAPRKIESYSVSELFQIHCGFDLAPQTSIAELQTLAKKLNVDVRSAESIDDFFFLIFTEKIESQLPSENLTFVEKYPPYQAALARLTEDGWGDRFEAYWKGFELCNAFHELNDPSIQCLRAEEDLLKKKAMGKELIPLDEEFFQCLQAGLPPSGGIALGLERLFMCLFDLEKIAELKVFPL